MHEVLFRGAL